MEALDDLSPRELEVLALIASGATNGAIRHELFLSAKTIETHVRTIYRKLGLPADVTGDRRVLATLTYLRATGRLAPAPPPRLVAVA